jgi:hypothetical protein
MKRIFVIAVGSLLGFGLLGCGGEPTASTQAEKAAETAAVETAGEPEATAPAVETSIPANTPPDQVVSAFLEARRGGDAKTTVALLTSKARSATANHKIDVNGEALPDLQFQVAKPKYLKNQKGAHVSSIWTELLPDGSKASYEVVWVLRKEAAGWRVAGFAAELVPGTEPQFLDFEDPEDMIRKQEEALVAAETASPSTETANEPQPEQARVPTREGGTPKKR